MLRKNRSGFQIPKSYMKLKKESQLSTSEIAAVTGGYHGAPHHVLGPHPLAADDPKNEKGLVVRAFRPLEKEVFVLDLANAQRHKMRSIEEGFFEVELPDKDMSFQYRLILIDPEGREHEIEDPYRFSLWLTEEELASYSNGNFIYSYKKLGAHARTIQDDSTSLAPDGRVTGINFAVWAPNAQRVSIIGEFNGWDDRMHTMQRRGDGGIWEIFFPNLPKGTVYKFSIKSQYLGYQIDKADPYAFFAEVRPSTASVVWPLEEYQWHDDEWISKRVEGQALDQPINIYEVHLGSWRRVPEDNGFLNYRDLAHQLVDYVKQMGYTHIELLPVTEYPYDGSWGYQVVGYYAPTSRFGTPDGFKYFIDYCHQNQIGVILDWVPAHFPKDAHGLAFFDGTHLYEHADPRQGEYPEWGTKVFNFSRNEVQNFLLSNALFWLAEYHIDGLRVDAVAAMIYLDYGRESGDWIPNEYGGRENIAAINFLRRFNEVVHTEIPGILTCAEESTSWPMVTHSTYAGGLGFDMKWNMGWMHDMLSYMEKDPIYRHYHHNQITFSLMYAFSENFILPFSHDEVVHLKRSMLDKMPGDVWQKFANLRALYTYMIGHPGKKLLFMGGEFGQWQEWDENRSLDWHLLQFSPHQQLQYFVRELNALYKNEPALYEVDFAWEGFQWIDLSDVDQSIISFSRYSRQGESMLVFVCNFTPVPRLNYRVGLPWAGSYQEIFNSDWPQFGGGGVETGHLILSQEIPWQSCPQSASVNLPPLGVVVLKPGG